MSVQTFDMTQRRERILLPTREQVQAITVYEDLEAMLPDIEAAITKIETDLEFRDGDDDWHSRARGALTAHQICRKLIERRLRALKPKKAPSLPQAPSETKLEKARLGAQKQQDLRAAAEAKKERLRLAAQQAVAAQRAAVQKRIAQAMHSVSLGHAFMSAAFRELSPDIYEAILLKASKMVESDMRQMLKPEQEGASEALRDGRRPEPPPL